MPFALRDAASSSSLSCPKTWRGWTSLGSICSIPISMRSWSIEPVSVNSALSPLPSAFLDIVYHLPGQAQIAFSALGLDVVENYGFAVARGFGEPDVSGNHRGEYLRPQKIPQVRYDLIRQVGSFVVHRQEKAFYGEALVKVPPNLHQCVPKLSNALEREVFALDWDQDGIRGR